MGKEKQKTLLVAARYVLFCAAVVGIVLLCICHASCQITSEGIKVLEAEESPEIKSVKVLNENSIEVEFTKEVSVKSASVSKLKSGQKAIFELASQNAINAEGVLSTDGKTVVYNFGQSTDIGQRYQLFSEIADKRGNSLTFAVPFEGYNSRIPILIFAEICAAEGSKTSNKKTVAKKSEYIILRALTSGNIAGIGLSSAQYPKLSEYNFPSVEVKAGEYIMIHLKKYDKYEGQIQTDELGDNLALDKNEWSKSDIRDLYFCNTSKCISEVGDVILLRNKNTMQILDSVIYTSEIEKEKFKDCEEHASLAKAQGKWKSISSDYDPIIFSEKNLTNSTRGLIRKNCDELFELAKKGMLKQNDVSSSKNDWYIDLTLYNASRK